MQHKTWTGTGLTRRARDREIKLWGWGTICDRMFLILPGCKLQLQLFSEIKVLVTKRWSAFVNLLSCQPTLQLLRFLAQGSSNSLKFLEYLICVFCVCSNKSSSVIQCKWQVRPCSISLQQRPLQLPRLQNHSTVLFLIDGKISD